MSLRAATLLLFAAAACNMPGFDPCAPFPPGTTLYESYCNTAVSPSGICFLEADTGF